MGNIAADPLIIFRNEIFNQRGVMILIKIMSTTEYKFILETGIWALKSVFKDEPLPNYELVWEAIPLLAKLVSEEDNEEIFLNTLWILIYRYGDHRYDGNVKKSIIW